MNADPTPRKQGRKNKRSEYKPKKPAREPKKMPSKIEEETSPSLPEVTTIHRPPNEDELERKTSSRKSLASSVSDEEECSICIEPIKFYSLGPCNHRRICTLCCLRRRLLYGQNECIVCRQPHEKVVFTEDPEAPYDSFDLKKLNSIKELGVCFSGASESYFHSVMKMQEFRCPHCDALSKNLKTLKSHLSHDHKLSFCSVCLDDRKVFLQEQKTYTQRELQAHLKDGDKDTLIKHEKCGFCKRFYYDQDKLYEHLREKHETCFICEQNGIRYQYYKDYYNLEKHFREEHFLCEDANCRAKKFVVFKTKLDLQMHEVESHLDVKGSRSQKRLASQIKLDFNVRGGASRSLSEEQEKEKEEEEEISTPNTTAAEDFPSLAETPSPMPLSRASWGKGPTTTTPTQDNFPSLPLAPPRDNFPALPRHSNKKKSVWGTAQPEPPPPPVPELGPRNQPLIVRYGLPGGRGSRKKKPIVYGSFDQ